MGLYKEHFKHLIAESNDTQYKYACVYVEFNEEVRKPFVDFVNSISSEDINEEEGGREKDSHITILYGLKDGSNKVVPKLHNLLKSTHQLSVTLGKVTSFENERFDVLKVDVISPDLSKVNRLIQDNFDVHSSFPDYHPHITICYCKKGTAKKYVGSDKFQGKQFIFKNMIFSDKRGEATDKIVKIPLNEDLGYGGGMASGQAAISGQMGTFGSQVQPQSTVNTRNTPMNGNTVIGYGAYETIQDSDLDVPGIDKDNLRMGIRRELSRMKSPDKDKAKIMAVANLKKDPKYYSDLKMYNESSLAGGGIEHGNTIVAYGEYENLTDDDLRVTGIDPSELRTGLRVELSKMKWPDKLVASRTAQDNIKKNPRFYSLLMQYNESKKNKKSEYLRMMESTININIKK